MTAGIIARAALCALVLTAAPATARVTEITVAAVEPFADGASFGDAGAYERVKGTFKGELDPADPRNRVIVNLDKAPKNAAGRIEYEADFYILRPVDPARGSPKVLYDVTTRGRQYAHWNGNETSGILLPEDAEQLIAKARSEEIARRFAPQPRFAAD